MVSQKVKKFREFERLQVQKVKKFNGVTKVKKFREFERL